MRKFLTLIALALTGSFPLFAQYSTPPIEVSRPEPFSSNMTRQFPYSMSGQLIFTSGNSDYQGTGTVIFRRSVLTAAHNLWDADEGWSYNVEFNRARSGNDIAKQTLGNRMFVLGGYQTFAGRYGANSFRAFAYDLGGIRFSTPPAGGSYAGWRSDLRMLTTYNDSSITCLGYGADLHSGDELLHVEPTRPFQGAYGAFMENLSLTFEGGMSGGPIFAEIADGSLRVVGIVVAGSDDPPSGGIRAINPAGAQFISTYLRY
jgi:V8-like Glu-specific endopeptidase